MRVAFRSIFFCYLYLDTIPFEFTNEQPGLAHQQQAPVMVRLQFMDDIKELRSFCRKQYKIGDEIEFVLVLVL